jgi:hypothetical protein
VISVCGLSERQHRKGVIDPFGVVHFMDRRFTRRALRNFLLLVARRDREYGDLDYLNIPGYDWYYLWSDETTASMWAASLGVRLPARLSAQSRWKCLTLARKAGVKLSKRPAIYAWATEVLK